MPREVVEVQAGTDGGLSKVIIVRPIHPSARRDEGHTERLSSANIEPLARGFAALWHKYKDGHDTMMYEALIMAIKQQAETIVEPSATVFRQSVPSSEPVPVELRTGEAAPSEQASAALADGDETVKVGMVGFIPRLHATLPFVVATVGKDDPGRGRIMFVWPCVAEGCERPLEARGGELEPLDAHFDRLWRNGTDARNAQILRGLEEAVRLEARRRGESGEVVFRALVPHKDVPVPAACHRPQ
mmetsp:Transcript_18645/g.62804  ORF Transcript_18645/g.62804 Transcript_18645/m.62804 type:complete len:244 (+) Transcript_18645:634-1365(+)